MKHSTLLTIGISSMALSLVVLSGCVPPPKPGEAPTKPEGNEKMMSSPAAMMGGEKKMMSSPEGMMGGEKKMMETKGNPTTKEEKIENAMSAGPEMIAKNATVIDWPATETGAFVTLKTGTNGWTCLTDTPTSPGNDPICVDGNAMAWFQAYMAKKDPKITQAGIGYMLQGGSDASNTDPFATEPKAGEDWMNAPAHVMIFPAGKLDTAVYGTSMNGGPWIMWANTPYQHLMVPVK